MIYITFFIVILKDKRGVREAERGGKDKTTVNTGTNTGTNTPPPKGTPAHRQHTATPPPREKRYDSTQPPSHTTGKEPAPSAAYRNAHTHARVQERTRAL